MPPPPQSDWVWHGCPTSLLPNGTFKDLSLKWEPVVNRLNSLAALAVMAEWNIRQLSLRIFLSLSGKRPLVASFRAPSFVSRTDRILPAFCPCYRGVAGLLSRPTESLLCDWRGANAITHHVPLPGPSPAIRAVLFFLFSLPSLSQRQAAISPVVTGSLWGI